jgi:hypothetical protein
MNLPPSIANACRPLFDALPMEQAMPHLVGSHPKMTEVVQGVVSHPEIANRPALIAGLWLYVDDLERSHAVSQSLETRTGSFWHAIMHRREGDAPNSRYWLGRAAEHPLLRERPELTPDRLVYEVSRIANGEDTPALVERQRTEWQALFEWCAAHGE